MLQTRPSELASPNIRRPSTRRTCGVYTVRSAHAFAYGFLHHARYRPQLAFSYPSPLSGWDWTLLGQGVILSSNITNKQSGILPGTQSHARGRGQAAPVMADVRQQAMTENQRDRDEDGGQTVL